MRRGDPALASLASADCPRSSLVLPGAIFSILYAPKDEWLALVAQGWVLPFIVTTDRSGHAVLLERDR